jgi:hypothetical protein
MECNRLRQLVGLQQTVKALIEALDALKATEASATKSQE